MPRRPPSRCTWPRCPHRTPCPTHGRSTSSTARGYGHAYQQARTDLLASNPPCAYCGAPATTADHVPPLSAFPTPAQWRGRLVPACGPCNYSRGNRD